MRTHFGLIGIILLCTSTAVLAQGPAIHIPATGDGFDTYLAAAIAKKNVPARVVERADRATLTLKASPVEVRKDATSTKVMKCVFSSCDGIDGRASASVKLVDRDGTVVWSYSVSGDRDEKSRMAEAIAKHLKNDYFARTAASPESVQR
jgi:hypothetical protein